MGEARRDASVNRTRTILISGASRGIGLAVAKRLHAGGHRLSLGVRSPDAMKTVFGTRGSNETLMIHPYEATDPGAAQAWVTSSVEHFGGLDAVVHCAGIFSRVGVGFASGEEREIAHTLEVNLMGPWWLSRAAWPHLVAGGDGRLIVLVSMSGKRIKGNLAAYGASKFALLGLCQAMRNEGWDAGIRVTALCPSWVNTEMAAGVKTLTPDAMTQPESLAATVAHLLDLPPAAVPFDYAVSCQLES
ncbi:SDR family NAD(P)-dependent oxidoreductase [Synechococcus sp. CBW1002]|nr:SDR family NAD(P)-dependent oxidoreductase [Synechococcus sp. CBW1002]